MSLSCFTRISQRRCFKRMSIRTKQISQQDFFFLSTSPYFEVDNFWQGFFQMPAFLSLDIFYPLVPPLPDVLSLEEGGMKSTLLIWSYVLKSVKIYQLRPTSRYACKCSFILFM